MTILHTADWHLGVKTYGRRDSATGLNTRLLDTRAALEATVQHAIDASVDCFVFAGDAYHTVDPTPTQQKILAECLQPLSAAAIPIVMVIGNHDHPVTFGRASSLDIFEHIEGRVHFYRTPTEAVQVIDTPGGPLQVIPLPWPVRSRILSREQYRAMSADDVRAFIEEQYVAYVQRRAADIQNEAEGVRADGSPVALSPTRPTILVGHVTVQGATMAGSERTSLIAQEPKFAVSQLAVPPIDYVALGHIHHAQNRNAHGTVPVVYSGSIERVTFKERDDPKGFYMVDLAPGRTPAATCTHVETPARPFVALRVDATDTPDPTDAIVRAIAARDIADAIVRVRYRVDESQLTAIDHQRLREALAPAHTIAAIERQVEATERKRRTHVKRDDDLASALRQYIQQHDELAPLADELVDAALDIQAEHEQAPERQSSTP